MSVEDAIDAAVAAAVQKSVDALCEQLPTLVAATSQGHVPERLLTRQGLAEWASCSVRTVDKLLADGCPHYRLGGPNGSPRFAASEVSVWLSERLS